MDSKDYEFFYRDRDEDLDDSDYDLDLVDSVDSVDPAGWTGGASSTKSSGSGMGVKVYIHLWLLVHEIPILTSRWGRRTLASPLWSTIVFSDPAKAKAAKSVPLLTRVSSGDGEQANG